MQGLPFDIPRSLSIYVTQFESDPEKGIANLKTCLNKRGLDAVGYCLLSWLHHKNNQQEQAIHYALKAKCSAPGSPFFEYLHYFLVHPDHFNAWKPFDMDRDHKKINKEIPAIQSGYTLDLDHLIEQLSKEENRKIDISENKDPIDHRDLGENAKLVNDIVSETLAKIYEKQNRYEEAIRTLEKLQKIKPNKADAYRKDIERLRTLMEQKTTGQQPAS
ncbi:MAG: hypothetical protein WD097_06805 [Balneolales bacterium]